MLKQALMVSTLAGALAFTTGFALAADQKPIQQQTQAQIQEQVYGSQLMTQQQRDEHLAKMHTA
jgi:hypothetical protein